MARASTRFARHASSIGISISERCGTPAKYLRAIGVALTYIVSFTRTADTLSFFLIASIEAHSKTIDQDIRKLVPDCDANSRRTLPLAHASIRSSFYPPAKFSPNRQNENGKMKKYRGNARHKYFDRRSRGAARGQIKLLASRPQEI